MPSLSDKLKSLGVKVGASHLPPPAPRPADDLLDLALSGHAYPTSLGETYVVENRYPAGHPHGLGSLEITAPLDNLAVWAGDSHLKELPPQAFAFIDTETTGLSGGTGTYAFLIGAGRFEGDEFHLVQFFMRDPAEEPAQLAALEEFLAPCRALVSYNGKAFDVPLLASRYVSHGWRMSFDDFAHVDLLHLARRLWRNRLPSRTLGNIEAQILGTQRTGQDVPGWMIPQMYFEYLQTHDPEPLRSVFYHNAMDVISLAALLNHSAALLAHPLENGAQYGVDLISLAQLFEDLGDLDSATSLYVHGLQHLDAKEERMPREVFLRALDRLALIHKRGSNLEKALDLWQEAARQQHIQAHIELAKHYEHNARDYPKALFWTEAAINHIQSGAPAIQAENRILLAGLHHRRQRLFNKLNRQNT